MSVMDDVRAYLQQNPDFLKNALSGIPGASSVADIASNAGPLIDEAAKNPTIQAMANGVTGAPITSDVPNPGNPVSGLAEGMVAPTASNALQDAPPPAPVPTPIPDLSAAPAAPEASTQPSSAPSPTSMPDATSTSPAPITIDPTEDQRRREAMNAEREHKRRMASLPGAIAGAGDAIAAGAKAFGVNNSTDTQDKVLDRAKDQYKESGDIFEMKLRQDPNSGVSKSYRSMVQQIVPDLAKNPNFSSMSAQEIGDKLPMIDTMMKAQAQKDTKELGLKQVQASKDAAAGQKHDTEQDRLEAQAMQRVSSLRGDQALARIETQRDGAISAYSLLQQAKNEKRPLTQAEYYDLLGQLWKSRSGAAPTQESMRDLDSRTFKGDITKMATYFTGKPQGATTEAVLDNLRQFTKHTGDLTDAQHDAYMAPHLVKPAGLDEDRWNPIKNTARGMSFADAVKRSQGTQAKPKLSKDSLGLF